MSVEIFDFQDVGKFIADSDLPFEYELIEDSSLNNWLRYYWSKDTLIDKLFVLQRACYSLPRSYKLWNLYLSHYLELIQDLNPIEYNEYFLRLNNEFEKCLELLNKMPMIWVKYLNFLMKQPDVSLIRRKFNQALRNLPVTQHNKIWPLYLIFADEIKGKIGSQIYLRYLTFNPNELELVFEKLLLFNDIENSFKIFDRLISIHNSLDIYLNFVDFLLKNNYNNDHIFEQLINNGLINHKDQIGKLYVKLSTHYIKKNNYLKARQIFEKGLKSSLTIKDFTIIYDSYTEFEETLISNLMKKIQDLNDETDIDLNNELDFRLLNFEKLMDKRPFLISDIKLKQNKNNVDEWLNRIKLFDPKNLKDILQTYVDAITTIDPKLSTPGLYKIWLQYSKVYEDNRDLKTARTILDKAVKVPFNSIDELVNVWIEWAELELRQDNIDLAIRVMEVATLIPNSVQKRIDITDNTLPVQTRVHKSIKLWSFYLDLVESSNNIEKTKSIYEKLFDLKIATPLTIINYANFLEDNNRYEESFKIYEKGISIFKYPVVFEIWNIYLAKVIQRNLSIERIRDLFDQSLINCPSNLSKSIYILYSKFEQDRGSVEKSIKILKKGILNVDIKDKVELYEILIQLKIDNYGISSSRDEFQEAINILPTNFALPFILKFTSIEIQLKEYERARSLFKYGSQLQSVEKNSKLWDSWNDFELSFGNVDTYKELLKSKRFATDQFKVNSEDLGFVKSSDGPKVSSINASKDTTQINPDAIDLDI